MKILITGGKGYLGGRLCQSLIAQGHDQIFIGSRSPVTHASTAPQEVMMDWSSPASLGACCVGMDVIVHLAGMNAQDCQQDPIAALVLNGIGTAHLLQAAKQAGVKRFIYLSTAHVYGSPLVGDITEASCPFPIHPYATSHRAAEDLVLASHHAGEMEGVVLRLSNAFGAPASVDANCWELLFNDLCRQAVTQKTITLRSSGLQRRDFIPITDACAAIQHVMIVSLTAMKKPLFNVGGDWSPTVFEIATLIMQRVELLFGYCAPIHRVMPARDECSEALSYSSDRLRETGFALQADRMQELDRLLYFCRDSFGTPHGKKSGIDCLTNL